MKSYSYGVVPPLYEFEKAFDREVPHGWYNIRLNQSDSEAAEGTVIGTGDLTVRQLYKGVNQLTRKWEDGDEAAGDLASSILYTLGFEWI